MASLNRSAYVAMSSVPLHFAAGSYNVSDATLIDRREWANTSREANSIRTNSSRIAGSIKYASPTALQRSMQ